MQLPRRQVEHEAFVTDAMQTLARESVHQAPLPDPSFIWWKAQFLRRLEAEREATAPIEIGDRVHVGAAIVGAVALAIGAWDQVRSFSLPPAASLDSELAIALAAVTLLSVVAFATFDAIRNR